VVLSLGAAEGRAVLLPIPVAPLDRQMLGGAAQSASFRKLGNARIASIPFVGRKTC
jgi:hypothetical protein